MRNVTGNCYRKSGIYQIKNLVNGKCYVGSSNNLGKRLSYHHSFLKQGLHFNIYLQRAYNKYEGFNFEFSILEYCEISELQNKEQLWISKLESSDKDKGYNLCPIAYSQQGRKQSKEEIQRRVSKLKGRKFPPEFGQAISERKRGRRNSKEHIANFVKARTGVPLLKRRRILHQFTKDGVFIKEWLGIREIEIHLGIKGSNIYNHIAGKNKSAGGFTWKKVLA